MGSLFVNSSICPTKQMSRQVQGRDKEVHTILPPSERSLIQRPAGRCCPGHQSLILSLKITRAMPASAARMASTPVVLCIAATAWADGEGSGAACLMFFGSSCKVAQDLARNTVGRPCLGSANKSSAYRPSSAKLHQKSEGLTLVDKQCMSWSG